MGDSDSKELPGIQQRRESKDIFNREPVRSRITEPDPDYDPAVGYLDKPLDPSDEEQHILRESAKDLVRREKSLIEKVEKFVGSENGITTIEPEDGEEDFSFITRSSNGTITFTSWNRRELAGRGQNGDIELKFVPNPTSDRDMQDLGIDTKYSLRVGTSTEDTTRKKHHFDDAPPLHGQISEVSTYYYFNLHPGDEKGLKKEKGIFMSYERELPPLSLPMKVEDYELAGGVLGTLEKIFEEGCKPGNTKFVKTATQDSNS